MRIALLAATAATLISAYPAHAADLAATAAALRDKALKDTTAWDVTESLTTEVGARPQGSPGMDRARDWGVAKLKSLGFENVHVETFETGSWLRGAESAEVVSPYPQKLQILGLGRSTPTPAGGLEAEIALFKTLDEMLALPPGALKGKIAVVTQRTRRTQDIKGYADGVRARSAGGPEAAKRGAAAYLVRSVSTDDTRLPHTGGGGASGIPMAALSTPDADLLERMVARGKPVRIKLSMASTQRDKAPAYNVVGEIKGRERPEEVIVIGGHLDSWDAGTGAVDDAAGIAITTAAAKLISDLPQRPRRTIRVVMWGAEEQGGSGQAYADAHAGEAANIIVAGESDLGAGEIFNAKLPLGSPDHPAMKAFAATVAPLTIISRQPAEDGGADVAGLKRLGVPVTEFQQDATRYFDLHHSADDTLDKVDPKELAQNVAVWTAFVYTVADSDIDFRKTATVSK